MNRKLERYKRLLRVRKIREDAHSQTVFAARKAVAVAVAERDRVSEERLRLFDRASESVGEALDASKFRNLYGYEEHLSRVVDQSERVILERREEMRQRQEGLEQAFRERRVAERLVERTDGQEQESRRRSEQRMLDELSSARRRVLKSLGDQS